MIAMYTSGLFIYKIKGKKTFKEAQPKIWILWERIGEENDNI